MANSVKVRGLRDVGTPGRQRLVTDCGDVQIQQADAGGLDWEVLPLGGAPRRVRGKDAAVAQARELSRTSAEWRRGDSTGERSSLENIANHGPGLAEDNLRQLQANLRREVRSKEATDFDRGYVVGYERGTRKAASGDRFRGRVGAGFEVEPPAESYPPPRPPRPDRPLSRQEIEHQVAKVVHGWAEDDDPGGDWLFIATFPTGISYADRKRERHGDYLRLAFLPFGTLALEWSPGVSVPLALREAIDRHARGIQARRGEPYQVSSSGQSVILGK